MEKLKEIYELMLDKTNVILDQIGDTLYEYPQSHDGEVFHLKNKLSFNHIFVWMSSFYTARAGLAFQTEKDINYLRILLSFEEQYEDKVINHSNDTMHDLGFLYSLYSVMIYKITNSSHHKKVAVHAADVLARRFDSKGGYIRAWGRMDNVVPSYVDELLAKDQFFTKSQGLAIIDCMMNLPLLFWASEVTKNPYYSNIAKTHADTTMRYFIRGDLSNFHAFRFDESTGSPLGGCNFCGKSNDSYWARGATWGIYGFAIAYRYTNKIEYLDISIKLAKRLIKELDESLVPIWDFRLDKDEPKNKDTSVNAILACAIIEILKHRYDQELSYYKKALLKALVNDEYMCFDKNKPMLLKQSDGINVFSSYGDYFYMQALAEIQDNIVVGW